MPKHTRASNEIRVPFHKSQSYHNSQTTRHLGRQESLDLVSQLYWWLSMITFVNKYVTDCHTCQRCKSARHLSSMLQPHKVLEGPWQTIKVDLIIRLPSIGR